VSWLSFRIELYYINLSTPLIEMLSNLLNNEDIRIDWNNGAGLFDQSILFRSTVAADVFASEGHFEK
jgi:hypothetical protein